MSYTPNALVSCPTIQDDLNNYFATCDASKMRTPMPFFEFLMSPLNRGSLQQSISPGNGKIRNVDLIYNQRFLESQVTSNVAMPLCTATNFRSNNYTNYAIDTEVNDSLAYQYKMGDFIESCQTKENYMAELIQSMVNAVIERVASRQATAAYALAGGWGSDVQGLTGSTLQVRTTRSGSTDEVYPWTMQEIQTALEQSGYCNGVAIFGGTALRNYAQRMLAGCCSSQGIDLGAIISQFGTSVSYDRRLANAAGSITNNNLAVMPGSLQLVTYNHFDGSNTIVDSGTLYSQQVIFDPETSFPLDLMMKYDCGKFHIAVTATSKLFSLPADLFQSGDILSGVNFAAKINVAN